MLHAPDPWMTYRQDRIRAAYARMLANPKLPAWIAKGHRHGLRLASLEEVLYGAPDNLYHWEGSPNFVKSSSPGAAQSDRQGFPHG